jgi:hypothetical protein
MNHVFQNYLMPLWTLSLLLICENAISQIPHLMHPPSFPNQNNSNLLYHADGPICTDGPVEKMIANDNKILITGYFSSVGKCSGNAILYDTNAKKADLSADISVEGGQVNTIIPDGSGGWFLGGNFSRVGGVARQGLAHITSTNDLDLTFVAEVIGEVKTLYKDGASLLVGGEFTAINSVERINFASVNVVTGNLDSINVSTTGPILAIEKEGSNVIIGGNFDLVKNSARSPGKIIDANSPFGLLDLPLIENVSHSDAMEYEDTTIYKAIPDGNNGWIIAGDFDQIGGAERLGIARINSDGSLHVFNPSFVPWWSTTAGIPYITSISINGNDVWISGSFMNVNGSFHPNLVVLDKDTGAIKSSNFCTLSSAYDIKFDATNAFLAMDSHQGGGGGAGYSNHWGGTCYGTAAAVDTSDGSAEVFPVVNAPMRVSIPDGAGGWYIGGSFTLVGDSVRTGLARVNADGSLHAFSLNFPEGSYVDSLFLDGNILYFSGYFLSVEGQARDGLGAYNLGTSSLVNWSPNFLGQIKDWETDGSNIYFVGNFEFKDAGTSRTNLASIDSATQALTSWSPTIETWNVVSGIHYYSGNLYIAGSFSEVNGTARNNLASISTAGVLQAWNPNSNSDIYFSHLVGEQLFLYGYFTTIGGVSRTNMASFTLSTGNLTSWNPAPNNEVQGFADDGTNLFVSGRFTNIAGNSRHRLASFSLATRNINGWTTTLRTMDYQNNYQISVSTGKLLLGGNTIISHGGTARDDLASINKTTYALTSWNPGAVNGQVTGLAVGASLYVIGWFSQINGTNRSNMASINLTTGAINGWNPSPNSSVSRITDNGTNLYIYGSFTTISGQARSGLASYNLSTGALTAWNPNVNFTGGFWGFHADTSRVVITGEFSNVDGNQRLNTVTVDPSTGAVQSWVGHFKETMLTWSPSTITAAAISGDQIFFGGIGYYGGTFTKSLAKVDGAGVVQNWFPFPNGSVEDIEVNTASTIFVGGGFTSVGGQARNFLAEVSTTTAAATAWTADTDGLVTDLHKISSTLYIAGGFHDVKGSVRDYLAAVNVSDGNPTSWDPVPDNPVTSISSSGSTIFVSGDFSTINGQAASKVAGINAANEALSDWRAPIGGQVYVVAAHANNIFIGGSISSFNAQSRSGIALIDELNGKLLSWNPSLDGVAMTIAYYSGKYYVGGSFSTVNGQPRGNIASFDSTTFDLLAWNPSLDGGVRYLEADNSKLYVLGDFANVDATPRNLMASFDTTTGSLTGWDPNPSLWWLNEVVLSNNILWVGGGISEAFGQQRNSFLAFDTATGNMTSFDPPPDNDGVITMAVGSTSVFAIGSWNYIGSRAESFVEINIADSTLTTYNPEIQYTNRYDTKLNVIGGNLYFSGGISMFEGQTRNNIAVVDIATKTLQNFDFNYYNENFRPYKSGSNVYFYGGFNTFEGLSRQGIYLGY